MTAMRAGSMRGIGGEPVEEGADVPDRILPQRGAVVEADEALAVAGRAADVGIEDGDAELVDQIIVAAEEAGPRLALGPAMNVDDQRPAAGKAGRVRAIEEARHVLAVETLDLDELGLGIDLGIEAAGLAARPAGDGERGRVDRIGVGRAGGGREA